MQYRLATGERGRLQKVSMSGQVVAEQDVVGTGKETERELNIDGQVSGLYLLKLSGPGIAETVKVLLQR